jgi:hypothetical protein
MPFETVQYPRTDASDGTEVSVNWSKGSHLQLKVQRHVWVNPPHEPDWDNQDAPLPARSEPLPLGTVKGAEDNSQIAFKIDADLWTVCRATGGVETCSSEQIAEWPVIWYPDERPVESTIFTDCFTREDVNAMIRALRRARNDAFGQDE